MSKIKNIIDLEQVVRREVTKLSEIPEFLNEAGVARLLAFQRIQWHLGFVDSLEELSELDEFRELVNLPNMHPEYYRVIRLVNRFLDDYMKHKE